MKDTLPGLVAIQAEGNFVTLSFVREMPDPVNKGQKYTTTWFDMFRIDRRQNRRALGRGNEVNWARISIDFLDRTFTSSLCLQEGRRE